MGCIINAIQNGEIAQLVEQGTENPCVPGSTPGLATLKDSVKAESFFVYSSLFQAVLSLQSFKGGFNSAEKMKGLTKNDQYW